MKNIIDILEQRISNAMQHLTGRLDCAAIVRLATDAKFGDYQVNGVMAIAKQLKTNPHKLAEEVLKKLDVSDLCEPPEIAGPGFINLRLKSGYVAGSLLEIHKDKNLGIEKTANPQTIVVDFSGPNIAKQMHVGHLRSTIIGDCICRMLECIGHNVIRQNHIGDWGTQFGMLITILKEQNTFSALGTDSTVTVFDNSVIIKDLEELYRQAKQRYDSDENFAQRSRKNVVKLHNNDIEVKLFWHKIVEASLDEVQPIYKSLKTTLEKKHARGESFYNDMLPGVVQELKDKGLAVESDGAICVFPPGFKTKEGEPLPFIIQKSDGAFLYATTDLAALRYRVNELKADSIIYVTDSRQKLHFEMLFAVAELAGWEVKKNTELRTQNSEEKVQKTKFVHVMFGSVLGENGQPLKTRSGENVKLRELLDEAVERAKQVVEKKNPELPQEQKNKIAQAVGIGAVKYADYSNNRTSDYVFSFDKMLAMEGNTAPYMQYAYARIKSIERKAQSKGVDVETELAGLSSLNLTEQAELDLAKHLIRYGEAIQSAVVDYRPNYLTAYLYELAQKFSSFYTSCPVIDAGFDKRPTRLLLCDLTAGTIGHGLHELLGIDVLDQM
jgi:arginyl-tRNA synthetase